MCCSTQMPRATSATSLQSEDVQNCCTTEEISSLCPACDCGYLGSGWVRWYRWGCRAYGSRGVEVWGGAVVIGSMVIWIPARVPIASADTDVSGCGPDDRVCTRQVAHAVRYLSVKGRHNARPRMQSGVC